MSRAFKVITPVAVEPITLQQAKNYLRVDFTDDDQVIQDMISRARSTAETITGRAYASQQIQLIYTIDRPKGGELYGPIDGQINWYHYQEQLGANPFAASMFYFDLDLAPIDLTQTVSVQTRETVFDSWTDFTGVSTIDDTQEPARMYFQTPPTDNQWKFVYWVGYNSTYPIPKDLLQPVYELIGYWYEFREAQDLPAAALQKLLSKRVDWI